MLTVLAAIVATLLAADAKPAAMVLAVQGSVTVQTKGGTPGPLRVMHVLRAQDRLTVPADGSVLLLILADKHRERLKAKAQVTVTAAGCQPATDVERLAAVQQNLAALYAGVRSLTGEGSPAGSVFRKFVPPAKPPRVTPMCGATLVTDRPALAWQAVDGATEYHVELFRTDLDKEKRLWERRTREAKLDYPGKEAPLEFEGEYRWTVSAKRKGHAAESVVWESFFFLATRTAATELAKIKSLTESKDPAVLLLTALTYQEYGIDDEALALFERLAKLMPKEGQFQKRLAEYYKQAGRLEEAKQAREKAKQLGVAAPDR